MENQLVITVKDLLLFVLWGSIVTLFVYLIMILRRVLKIMKSVNLVVDGNRQNIDATLNIVPELTKHIETITGEVAHDVQAFRPTVDNVAETTESITETIKSNKGFIDGLSSFMHTFSVGKALYDKFFSSKVQDIKDIMDEVDDVIHPNHSDETKHF